SAHGHPGRALRVAFPATDGRDRVRWIQPSRLTRVETVYAMTVHKAQGSEFDHTALLLPDREAPVLTRELLYTAITRARRWFTLIEPASGILEQAIQRRVIRGSGLGAALRGTPPDPDGGGNGH
ncbi:MAG: exodeoxyribonuclease V subunit alpha, partial [Thioalkalivibrio sp.]